MSTRVEERIGEVAARQHGAVTRAQLREAGLTDRSVSRRVASGRLHRLHQGVYRVGPLVATYVREMAAVLACGAGATASHRSAAWLLEVGSRPGDASRVEVAVPGNRVVRRPGIRVFRARYLEIDGGESGQDGAADPVAAQVTTAHGIPVTAPGRTLVDLAGVLPVRHLERAVARAERSGLVTLDHLTRLVAFYRGRAGIAALAAVIGLDGGPAFTRSEFESRFLDALLTFGLPRPQCNVHIAGYEVDFWFESARLVVELDGQAYHRSWRSQLDDRRRDRDLAARGIQVIRITWDDLTREPGKTVAAVAAALALRDPSMTRR
jgi:very-short-patch-repair endonuclease/predicted transcriptional regulator of viral defense system